MTAELERACLLAAEETRAAERRASTAEAERDAAAKALAECVEAYTRDANNAALAAWRALDAEYLGGVRAYIAALEQDQRERSVREQDLSQALAEVNARRDDDMTAAAEVAASEVRTAKPETAAEAMVDMVHDTLWSADHRGEDVVQMARRVKARRDVALAELADVRAELDAAKKLQALLDHDQLDALRSAPGARSDGAELRLLRDERDRILAAMKMGPGDMEGLLLTIGSIAGRTVCPESPAPRRALLAREALRREGER